MSSARRPLLTAIAAGTLLGALWFVPTAHATPTTSALATSTTAQVTQQARALTAADSQATPASADNPRLADTGSFDTTPYLTGGAALLIVGAGFVGYSVRRGRLDF